MNEQNSDFKNQKTNWKYLLIVIILAFIVGGGILGYGRIIQKKIEIPEIKIPKKEKVPDYTTSEAKEIVPTPVEKKIPNELANIFREEINKDLMQDLRYRDDISSFGIEGVEEPSIDCDRPESVDLNNDTIEEFIIFPYWFCGGIRGAAENGPIYIFQKINEDWKNIGRLDGNKIDIEKSKTNGYYDIETFMHLGAGSAIVNSYQWEESILSYELKKSEETEVGL